MIFLFFIGNIVHRISDTKQKICNFIQTSQPEALPPPDPLFSSLLKKVGKVGIQKIILFIVERRICYSVKKILYQMLRMVGKVVIHQGEIFWEDIVHTKLF